MHKADGITPPAVYVSNLTVAYRQKPVVDHVTMCVPKGAMEAVVGPNGAGKSTLLKAILGILPSASGEIKVFGKQVKSQRACIAYIPQRSSVDWDFPTTVFDVVLMGSYGKLGWMRRPGKLEKEQTYQALEKVGMTAFASRQISELSGGQQQRVFLARALVQDAELYFMDEPFQGVDAATEQAIVRLLQDLKQTGKTLLVVHHDLQTVKEYFDRVLLLNVSVIKEGSVETVFTQQNIQTAYSGYMPSIA
ncbi:MAG: metal ABC transporter ATP-binding protein [Treponema sp.]